MSVGWWIMRGLKTVKYFVLVAKKSLSLYFWEIEMTSVDIMLFVLLILFTVQTFNRSQLFPKITIAKDKINELQIQFRRHYNLHVFC